MPKKESNTKSFILRIDSEMMDAIEAWAADEFRSTNGQLQWIIAEALRKEKRLPKKMKEKRRYHENDDCENQIHVEVQTECQGTSYDRRSGV
ncbi:MAG: Arc family DNA-binding protein [Prevotella sp.]|nr:Arc family DNA-binding protein [Prevotella sp.]